MNKRKKIFTTLLLFSLLSCSVTTQDSAPLAPSQVLLLDPFSQSLLNPPDNNWLTNGGNIFNQRWSPLEQINRENVSELKAVWRTHLNGSGMDSKHSGEAQPLIHNGIVYIITGDDDVFALSLKSGEILWEKSAELREGIGRSICCGWTSRGLAIGDGRIYVGQLDSRLVALDQTTGEELWSVQAMPWQNGYSITSAPLYFNGMVITGFAGAEFGVRGLVKAFDAATGEEIWRFYTVPGPGEAGHETWPQDSNIWKLGGATVWQTPAVDPELGLLYFSTGNPGSDFNGGVRQGDNLYANSIVAIDLATGSYRWHFQQVHHDIWDYDSSNPVILFDLEEDGEIIKGLAQASKTGWVYILDRTNGEPLVGIEEKAVLQEPLQFTSATQPYPLGDSFVPQEIDIPPEGVELLNQGRIFTPFTETNPALVQPGASGGANWAPSAYDPERELMYICSSDSASYLQGGDPDMPVPEYSDGSIFMGSGFYPDASGRKPTTGIIAAMDVKTNKLVWRYRWEESCYSGFVATAGDILFVGRNDGRLTALDSDTGKQVWEFETEAGMNSTVSIVNDQGKQYVVAYSAGNLFAGSVHGDSVWVFSLDEKHDGTREEDFIPAEQLNLLSSEQEESIKGDAVTGEQIYRLSCLPCHGEEGLGGHGGGVALNQLKDISSVSSLIKMGRKQMPAFETVLSENAIKDVSAYIIESFSTN